MPWMYSTVTLPAPDDPAEKSIKIGRSAVPMSTQVSASVIVPAEPSLTTLAAVPAANAVNNEVEVEVVRPIVKWIQDNVNPICIGINAVSRGQLGEDRGAIVLKSTRKINALLGMENMYVAAYAFGCWHGFWKILF